MNHYYEVRKNGLPISESDDLTKAINNAKANNCNAVVEVRVDAGRFMDCRTITV